MDTVDTERVPIWANMQQRMEGTRSYEPGRGRIRAIELHLIMDLSDRANGIAVLEQSTAFSAFFALLSHSHSQG